MTLALPSRVVPAVLVLALGVAEAAGAGAVAGQSIDSSILADANRPDDETLPENRPRPSEVTPPVDSSLSTLLPLMAPEGVV